MTTLLQQIGCKTKGLSTYLPKRCSSGYSHARPQEPNKNGARLSTRALPGHSPLPIQHEDRLSICLARQTPALNAPRVLTLLAHLIYFRVGAFHFGTCPHNDLLG